ncbi:MAG: SHOCT domain-containing protein [Thermodesulfobacteriota bacterium]
MTRKVHVTPGGLTLLQAKAGMVAFTLFLIFGLGFGFVVLRDAPDSEGGMKFLIGMFFLIWTVVCISAIVIFSRTLSKSSDLQEKSLVDINLEEPRDAAPAQTGDFESRLRRLENLKRDGLITEKEYQAKREQIISEKW